LEESMVQTTRLESGGKGRGHRRRFTSRKLRKILVRLLHERGVKRSYHKALADFADRLLDEYVSGVECCIADVYDEGLYPLFTALASTRKRREYSDLAMEFVADAWQMEDFSILIEEAVEELIAAHGFRRSYFQQVPGDGQPEWLVNTTKLYERYGVVLN
jgi:hypothetical protein